MRRIGLFAVLTAVAIAAPAHAIIITQLEPETGVAMADASWRAPTVVNGHIVIPFMLQYFDVSMIGAAQITQFQLEAADVGKDIWLVNYNNDQDASMSVRDSTIGWSEYHIILSNAPALSASYANAQFANLGGVTSDVFGAPISSGNSVAGFYSYINFAGGPVPAGSAVNFSGIQIHTFGDAGDVFYLQQIPIPEPATMGLVTLAGLLLAARRNRHG